MLLIPKCLRKEGLWADGRRLHRWVGVEQPGVASTDRQPDAAVHCLRSLEDQANRRLRPRAKAGGSGRGGMGENPRCDRYSPFWTSGRFGSSGIDRHPYRASDGKSRSGAPSSFSVRPETWYSKYGARDRSMSLRASGSRSVPLEAMMGTRTAEDDEIDHLMDQMDAELAKKRQLRREIAECKQILQQASKAKLKSLPGGTNFESLSYSRARGPQRVRLSGLFPHISNPASYNLGML